MLEYARVIQEFRRTGNSVAFHRLDPLQNQKKIVIPYVLQKSSYVSLIATSG